MNIIELRKVISAIEKAPRELFDMGTWQKETECGTAGCAIGHYCFQNPDSKLQMYHGLEPMFENDLGLRAVAAFFDISFDEAINLFAYSPNKVQTKEAMIDHITKFIRNEEINRLDLSLDRYTSADIEEVDPDEYASILSQLVKLREERDNDSATGK